MRPDPQEWDLSNLAPNRRELLENNTSFEDIIESIATQVVKIEPWLRFYDAPPRGVSRKTKQVCFKLELEPELCDQFYNSPDGLRGRYWQSPDRGDAATRKLIHSLREVLIKSCPQEFDLDFVRASLDGVSAKVWIFEESKTGDVLISSSCCPQLCVKRWEENEKLAGFNNGLWRCAPVAEFIEIKGALIDPDSEEHIPEGKRDRSYQIHCFGFT